MPLVLFVLLAIVILILFSGFMTFYIACVRRNELNWLVEDEIKNTPYGKHFQNIQIGYNFLQEHNAQDLWMDSFDGKKLYAAFVAAENPRGTIILAHGYRSSKLVDFGIVFQFYHDMGLNVLVPDQRAHGMSEGHFITFGVKESKDMLSWINYHNRQFGTQPLFLSGLSMGASTMLYLADKDLPKNVRGIIADCGFTSPRDIIASVYKRVIHLPAIPSIWATDLFARIIAGFSLFQEDSRKSLKNSGIPIIMVHGTEDGFVPCDMTREGYAACVSEKQLFLVEGADHGVSYLVQPERYRQLVTDFINSKLEDSI